MTTRLATKGTNSRILVVDDEPSIVDAVATALRYEGFEVREEGTGRAALTAVADFDPDLVVLDEGRHEVFRADTRIELTATEFNLLRFFLLNPRRVLSKGQILQNVWRYDFGGNSNVVETYVSYLRKKLDALGPPLIRTVRQAGYMLDAAE